MDGFSKGKGSGKRGNMEQLGQEYSLGPELTMSDSITTLLLCGIVSHKGTKAGLKPCFR